MKLCLVTCNIRFDNPADGNNAWGHRRTSLVSTLLAHSPDLIATQEGRFHQLKDMEEILGNYELIDHHRSWIKERMYPSFFVKKGAFEVLKSGDIWLSETPDVAGSRSFDSTFPRLMTWLKIQPVNSKIPLMIVNTHLDHVKPETRQRQVEVLLDQLSVIWKQDCPLVLMGDFNESPDNVVRRTIDGKIRGLQDAWKLFNSVEETSHHAFKGELQNGARIDWILIDRSLKVESCLMDKSHTEGRYPTDHFPVICTVTL